METSYINSINCFLDKQCLVNELQDLKTNTEKAEKYHSYGAKFHYKTDKTSSELAYQVLSDFLLEDRITKDKIDFIIFTCDNIDGKNDINTLSVNSFLNKLGITNAIPIFQGFSNCANIAVALNSAASLIESRRAKNILIISVDTIGGEDKNYIMDTEMSIYSDAAICVWLSSSPTSESLQITDIFIKNNPAQWFIDRKIDYQKSSINKLKLYQSISKSIKEQIGTVDYLILNNYFTFINEMFLGIFGIKFTNVNYSNASEIGHAPAGDVFINLLDLQKKHSLQFGQNIVLVSESPSLCIGIILKCI